MADKKTILVTGGNAGIGFALCTVLARDHGCKVYLGSRSQAKGAIACARILEDVKGADVELVIIDVTSEDSAAGGAANLGRRARRATPRHSVARAPIAIAPMRWPSTRAEERRR